MGQSIFNTLLIKSNHELINDIKDDIIVMNEDKSTTLKLTNSENENLQFDCDCQVGTDFILLRFNTYNTAYISSVLKLENPVTLTTFRRFRLTRKNVGTQYCSWSIVSGFRWLRPLELPLSYQRL